MSQYPAVIDVTALDGTNGFILFGAVPNDSAGRVSSAGDINGDGFDDIIIGAPNYGETGAAYVIFGGKHPFDVPTSLADLDKKHGFMIENNLSDGSSLGVSVSSIGDINGDGIDDIVLGDHGAGSNNYGAAYVLFGSADGLKGHYKLGSLDGTNGFAINGHQASGFLGISVGSAGDMNGDGIDDLVVGQNEFFTSDEAGVGYVIFGTSSGFDAEFDITQLDGTNGFRFNGNDFDSAGSAVGTLGDINGDGFDDVAFGAWRTNGYVGVAYVVLGHAGPFDSHLRPSDLDGDNGFKLSGANSQGRFGADVATAGDVNGDGLDDIVVAANGVKADGSSYTGAAYVVFGSDEGFNATINVASLDGENGFRVARGNLHELISARSAGDVNGDGFDDIIVGGRSSGLAYVVLGKASGFAADINLGLLDGSDGFKLDADPVANYGVQWVSSAGDVNGDGFADMMVGSPNDDTNGDFSGTTYVIYGIAPSEAVVRVGTVASQTLAGGNFDDLLTGLAGDDALFGGGGADVLRGGAGHDTIRGGLGADNIGGGGGTNVFEYRDARESTGAGYDTAVRANLGHSDQFDFTFVVSAVDVGVEGSLSTATFDGDLAGALDAAHLGQRHAVLFTASGGDLDGQVFLVVDANNVAGYQAGKDVVINLLNAKHLDALDTSDFI